MKKIILLLPILLISLNAGTIKAKRVKAKDRTNHHHSTHHSRHNTQEDVLLSTFEVSSEASSQVSFEISVEMSTEATSQSSTEKRYREENINRRRKRRYQKAISFLKSNRSNIDINMAQAKGEYLSSLLKILELKEDKDTLTQIQSDFYKLSKLDNKKLISTLHQTLSPYNHDEYPLVD